MERKIRKILVELGLKQYLPGFQYIIEVESPLARKQKQNAIRLMNLISVLVLSWLSIG